jgi:hypothetical protein
MAQPLSDESEDVCDAHITSLVGLTDYLIDDVAMDIEEEPIVSRIPKSNCSLTNKPGR